MRGFTERLVGYYTEVWNDEMWNDFMPQDEEATNKRAASSSSTAEASSVYIPPDAFKVRKVDDAGTIAVEAPSIPRPSKAPSLL